MNASKTSPESAPAPVCGKYALFRNAHKMKGLLGREKLSLPLDPYATATDWISPLSLRNFRANPAALRFAAGRDMLQNCSTVAPKFHPSPALGGSIGRDNLRLGTLFSFEIEHIFHCGIPWNGRASWIVPFVLVKHIYRWNFVLVHFPHPHTIVP